jgi:hypothetical protein
MKPLHLAAIFATFLLVVTAVNYRLQPPARPETAKAKKKQPAPTKTAEGRCTIKRAVFGGTQSALLKVTKDGMVHYVVLDLPTDNPRMPDYQSSWLEANYGPAEPAVVGVFPTVEEAVTQAASLCRKN